MSTISLPAQQSAKQHLRPFNVIRDLSAVADLIELCFYNTMDNEGARYVRQMRRASQDNQFLRWATAAVESASMPLAGYVWEENGEIVGNASLVPFRHHGKRIYLVANVAVHPDHRRRGIARVLTEQVMRHARQRGAESIWLHVRDDNPGAVALYEQLGFVERFWRTTWQTASQPALAPTVKDITITKRFPRFWPQQRRWLERIYPDEITWYREPNWRALGTGLWHWLYRIFIDYNVQQWAAVRGDRLLGVISWMPAHSQADPLWLAVPPDSNADAVNMLLQHARRQVYLHKTLAVEFPPGPIDTAFRAAGFLPLRTLIWMQAPGATR
jgi:ribosomal protein S18 acetylase RimI-like enzyme